MAIQVVGADTTTGKLPTVVEARISGLAPTEPLGLARAAVPPTLTLTKSSTPDPAITSPVVYAYNSPAFLFAGNGPGSNGIYGKNAVGSATAATFEWETDAPLMEIRLNGSNLKGALFVDGALVNTSDIVTDTSGADYLLKVDFGGVSRPRRFKFWGVNMLFGGIRVPGAYTAWKPVADKPLVWALTDSYGFGTGASPLVETAFMVACQRLGVEGLADGIGGTGWIEGGGGTLPSPESRITSKLATLTREPTEVWFMLGYNNSMSSLTAVAAGVNASVALVRTYWPNAIIRIFGPYTPLGITANLLAVKNTLKARAAELGVHFHDLEGVVTAANKVRYTGPDDVHASPAGHTFIGRRLSQLAYPVGAPEPEPTAPPAPTFGLTDWDHLYPLSALSLADGAALTTWPDSGSSPDPLTNIGTGGGSFGTALYETDEGGYLRLVSTSGQGKLATTTNVVNRPRTTVLVCRGTKGRQLLRVGGALLTRVGVTGEYLLTASGTGSGGQLLVHTVNADGWVCIIVRTADSSASVDVNGVKVATTGTWVPGNATTLRIQANDPDPSDFKFIGSVNRIISDTEAADIYTALKATYAVLV